MTHEEVTKDELGGAMTHNEKSGVAHFMAQDDAECLSMVRELFSFIPPSILKIRRASLAPIPSIAWTRAWTVSFRLNQTSLTTSRT